MTNMLELKKVGGYIVEREDWGGVRSQGIFWILR